jgi:hypothetical protein
VQRLLAGGIAYLSVVYRVIVNWSGGGTTPDDRGSVFFIFSESEQKIVFETFGHPEWNSSREGVRTIQPELYFKVGSDSRTYFVGVDNGGWESHGWGIFEFPSGRRVLER